MDINKIFKIGLLVLGFGYLAYMYCPHTDQAGRYSYLQNGTVISVFDTTNADVYLLVGKDKGGWLKSNPLTGKKELISFK